MRLEKCVLTALLSLLQFTPLIGFGGTAFAESAKSAVSFDIEGMSCQSCVNSITEALRATPGVEDVVVTLKPPRAELKRGAAAPSEEQLIKIITDLGYTAKKSEAQPASKP